MSPAPGTGTATLGAPSLGARVRPDDALGGAVGAGACRASGDRVRARCRTSGRSKTAVDANNRSLDGRA